MVLLTTTRGHHRNSGQLYMQLLDQSVVDTRPEDGGICVKVIYTFVCSRHCVNFYILNQIKMRRGCLHPQTCLPGNQPFVHIHSRAPCHIIIVESSITFQYPYGSFVTFFHSLPGCEPMSSAREGLLPTYDDPNSYLGLPMSISCTSGSFAF